MGKEFTIMRFCVLIFSNGNWSLNVRLGNKLFTILKLNQTICRHEPRYI